jgi:hypothetical protein
MSTGTVDPADSPVILPRVRRLLVGTSAVYDLADNQWEVKSPWCVRFLPPGKKFPYRESEIWVYIQLSGGLGPVRLGVELRQKMETLRDIPGEPAFPTTYRHVGVVVEENPFTFPAGDNRLTVYETAIRLSRVPFREEGVYEFRIIALTAEGHEALPGILCEVTMLEPTWRV